MFVFELYGRPFKTMEWFKFNLLFLGVLLWTSCYCTVSGESQTVSVWVKVGSDVTLPCHIEQPDGDADKMTVEWTGRPASDPRDVQAVHLFKDGRDVFNFAHTSYRTRASLSHDRLSRGDFSLKLLRVRFSDEGTFQCFDPHQRITREAQLHVVNVSQPVISPNGPTDGGVSLTCDSGCWFPQPEVSWLDADGNNIPAGPSVTDIPSLHCYEVQSNVTVTRATILTCRVHLPLFNLTAPTRTAETRTAETQRVISESDIPKEGGNTAAIAGGTAIGIFTTMIILLTAVLSRRYCKKQLQYTPTLETTKEQLKLILKKKFVCLSEWITDQGQTTDLGGIFIELCLCIRGRQWKDGSGETDIKRQDIFKGTSQGGERPIRTVMTTGVAGIGKTVLAQKYILEWAENKFDDVLFVFPFTFRDKHLENDNYSMVELVNFFVDGIKDGIDEAAICSPNVVFILDGLDHFSERFSLDFRNNRKWTDVTKRTSVDRLLTNLIMGELLPLARIWIITRPAAANKILSKYDRVDRVTEVTGFTDAQKDAFFDKTFRDDENEARDTSLTSYIKASESLHFMCHMPVFCWTIAKVLQDSAPPQKTQRTKATHEEAALPKTTAMFIHFMVVQSQHKPKKNKHHARAQAPPQAPDQAILSLGKLAFERLKEPKPIRETDLARFQIDRDAEGYSMRENNGLFSFVHQSVQGFLAALYVFVSFIRDGTDLLSEPQTPSVSSDVGQFLRSAVDKALQSPNGHWDTGHWFLRFLLGLSLEANQRLLQQRLIPIQPTNQETNGNVGENSSPESIHLLDTNQETVRYTSGNDGENPSAESIDTNQETVRHIKKKIRENLSPEKIINLLHCLNEMNDPFVVKEVQQYQSSGHQLSPAECSDLEFILLSRRVLDSSPSNTVAPGGTAQPGISQT